MPQSQIRLLVADDEPKYVRSLAFILERQGYEVLTAADGQVALELAAREAPALIMLDVRIPKVDGFEICRRIREFSLAPILMLTALGRDIDMGAGLAAGADDYLIKPFQIQMLLARLETLLSWSAQGNQSPAAEARFQIGDMRIDFTQRQVWVAQREVRLTAAEFRLLGELASAAGRSVPPDVLLNHVWGGDRQDIDQFVPIFINRLRQKIEAEPVAPQYILSQPGQRYSLGPLTVGK
jgi:DNA-binding response OmpR family regulator